MRMVPWCLSAAFVLCTSCTSPSIQSPEAAAQYYVVTEEELGRALELLQRAEGFIAAAADERTYFVDVEVLRSKDASSALERELLVTHYRTKGDIAILGRVNLTRDTVVGIETVPHLPVRLSQEEFELARRLALADPQLQALLAGRQVQVEAQVTRTTAEADPLFGHRVVNLLFRTAEGYLEFRSVTVDLTTETVTVDAGGPR